ncbi:MAG: transposase [Rikenellaceae bacterium]|jgi:hypothetical protein|nr:transposase [Rikenellaceae bacterium]
MKVRLLNTAAKPAILSQTEESREKDSLRYLWYSEMTYGESLYARVDTLMILPEPKYDIPAADTLEKGTKLTVVDFVKVPTTTTDAWGNPTTADVTYSKVSYKGGEGWQVPAVLIKCTAPDNWTRFTPTGLSKRTLWWILGLSVVLALAYRILKRRLKAKAIENGGEEPAPVFFIGVLYLVVVLMSLMYIFLQWGEAWDFFTRHFWAWSAHPFYAKVFVVLCVSFVGVIPMLIYELWLNTKTIPKLLIHMVAVGAIAVALCAATLITAWLMLMIAVLAFFAGAVDEYGKSQGSNTGGGSSCPRCGHTWVKSQSFKCPNCGAV